MPTYRCTASRRIADTSYHAGQDYQLDAELVQRYAGYFTPASQAAPVAATASEYDDSAEAAAESTEGEESAPAASKRRRRF